MSRRRQLVPWRYTTRHPWIFCPIRPCDRRWSIRIRTGRRTAHRVLIAHLWLAHDIHAPDSWKLADDYLEAVRRPKRPTRINEEPRSPTDPYQTTPPNPAPLDRRR